VKFIKELKINLESFIDEDFFNPNIRVIYLRVKDIWIEIDGSYSTYKLESFNKITNDSNYNKIKNFVDKANPKKFLNIRHYDLHYDFIARDFITYLKNNNVVSPEELESYKYKSSKYCYDQIVDKIKNGIEISNEERKKLEESIFRNVEYKNKYAAFVINDRLPSYEEQLLKLDLDIDEVSFYLRRVLIFLIISHHDYEKRTITFEKFYGESELFRKLVIFYIQKNEYDRLRFNFQSDILEDLIFKYNIESLEYYLEITYFDSNRMKNYYEKLEKIVERINKNPKAIIIYYKNKKEMLSKPKNKAVRETLMTDPESFAYALYNFYNKLTFEETEELFPGYQKAFSKTNDLKAIQLFFSFLNYKFFKPNEDFDPKKYQEKFSEYRKYLYDNYMDLIQKISKDPIQSYYFAWKTGFTFKEGEKAIFSNDNSRISYLSLIKEWGPSLIPDYDRYDLSILDNQEDDDDLLDDIGY
jgi:hypothetical protein